MIGTGAIWSLDAEQSVASISSGRYEPGCTIEVLTDGGGSGTIAFGRRESLINGSCNY